MAYNSAHTGPEIDAAVQMLGEVQDARDSTAADLAEVKGLSSQVEANTHQVAANAATVDTKTTQVLASVLEVEQARSDVLIAATGVTEARDEAVLSAQAAQASKAAATASEQAAAQSQLAAGLSEQVSAGNVAQFGLMLTGKVPTITNLSAGMVPLIFNEAGKVILWLENGRINGAGLSLTVAASVQGLIKTGNFNAAMLPLMMNDAGQVVAWLKSGRFNAAGLDLTIAEAVQTALASYQAPTTKFTDSSKLWLYRAQIANAMNGAGVVRVVGNGDSWLHLVREIPQPLADAMYSAYGQSGAGWISVYADEGGPTAVGAQLLNGAKLIKSSEWTVIDMSATESDSLDGHAASATGTTGRIDITALKTQALTWYYKDTAGTFRYSIDGGTPVVVTGGNTGLRKSIQITGLTDANHNIVFDLVGNTGTVVMYGGMATRTAPGVEFSKAGNGGSTTVQWAAIAPFVQAYAAELKPDLVIIVLGTNDFNQGITKATYKSSLQTLVNAYRVGSPNCGVLLMTPVRAQSSLELGLIAQYAEAMSEISLATPGVEFLNLNAFMPPRITSDAYGMWKDALHLSVAGGRFVTALLMKYFLRVN